MPPILLFIITGIAAAALAAVGKTVAELCIDSVKGRNKKSRRNLSGVWHAAWQTSVEGKTNINTEVLKITQRGYRLSIANELPSPENKIGGYLWQAEAKLYDNERIIGCYVATDPNVLSKGSLYFLMNHNGAFLIGKWVGCNYDSQFIWGWGVIAKDLDVALAKLDALVASFPEGRSKLKLPPGEE